jgi:endonuclease YncB( thermonuclease family)
MIVKSKKGPESALGLIYSAYVERMFSRKGIGASIKDQVQRRLSWLANQMREKSVAQFLIEQLQPSWLTNRKEIWVYCLTSRLLVGMTFISLSIPNLVLFLRVPHFSDASHLSLVFVNLYTPIFVGLVCGMLDSIRFARSQRFFKTPPQPLPNTKEGRLRYFFYGLIYYILAFVLLSAFLPSINSIIIYFTAHEHENLFLTATTAIDGDTITVLHNRISERIRLHGIDCQEKGQAYGKRAKQATSHLAFGKTVTVQTYGKDKYGRAIGDVTLPDETNLNQELVRQGWCWGIYDLQAEWMLKTTTGANVNMTETFQTVMKRNHVYGAKEEWREILT